MKLVRQPPNSQLCGQACVATIAGITLQESVYLFFKQGRTSTKDVIAALKKLNIPCGDKLISVKKAQKPDLCLVVLHMKDSQHKHLVVYWHGLYLDPAIGIVEKYDTQVYETSFLPIYKKIEELEL